MRSFWAEGLTQRYAALEGGVTSKVAIVGGSFAGLATAKYLIDRGFWGNDISIVDADVIGVQGGRCAGLVVSSTEDDYLGLKKEQGPEEARDLWRFNANAVDEVRDIIRGERLGCTESRGSRYLGEEDDATYLREEAEARAAAGFRTRFGRSDVKMAGYEVALRTPDDIAINPAKYCVGLAKRLSKRGCSIYEDTRVTKLDKKKLLAKRGSLEADIIVLAGQNVPKQLGYGLPTLPSYPFPMETYFLITEPLTPEQRSATGIKGSFWDSDANNYVYGRMTGDRLLFGGEFLLEPLAPVLRSRKMKRLERRFREKFPQLKDVKIEQKFAGPINTTIDEMPVVDNPEKGIYTIGASEGIAAATTGGRIVADMIMGIETENPYKPRTLRETVEMIYNNPGNFAKLAAYALGF